jgi:hypothetical protein
MARSRTALAPARYRDTRAAAPLRWRGIFRELDTVNDGRIPAILLSFVRAGVPVDDYIIVRGRDWLALHGRDEEGANDE